MRRREFIGLVGGATAWPLAVTWPSCSIAEGTSKVWRVGVLAGPPGSEGTFNVFERSLGDLGYVRDKNIVLVSQYFAPNPQSTEDAILSILPTSDLLVVAGTLGGVAAKKLVTTKPVIFVSVGAPVDIGLVESLSRPGGNLTGITFEASTETYAKRLQLLKEIMPQLNRVAVLQAKGDPNVKFAMASFEGAAPLLGVQLLPVAVSSPNELVGAFDEMKRNQSEALIVIAGLFTIINSRQIAALALAHRLPSCHPFKETVVAGGLIGLGPDIGAMWRQAAGFVDKIIRGAEPKDLPVQQPTRYELVVNLKTAKELSLVVPPSILARADLVIE
jgi:putative tryptophan/tyrosine transport system substrate-binding protein